jgi:formylglycine-generating enzyme required for sulfatase activity
MIIRILTIVILSLLSTIPALAEEVLRGSKSDDKLLQEISRSMVHVKGGCFPLGNVFGGGWLREKPVHEVCVNNYYLGKHEVTVGEFRKFVNATGYKTEAEKQDGCHSWEGRMEIKREKYNWHNPGFPQTENHPVVCVTWNDADAFIRWLNSKAGRTYRMPTEAEWEYAARNRGKKYKYSWGNGEPSGNIADEAAERDLSVKAGWTGYDDGYAFTSPVGSYKPNDLGMYDLSGNVYEWVSDWYVKDYYKSSPKKNPQGPDTGTLKILRGGSWNPLPALVKTTNRFMAGTGARGSWMGFRLAHSK